MSLSHPVDTLALESSEPGAALTAPALAHTYGRGASVSDRTCSIEGCAKAAECRGWCSSHYTRWRRHGDPLGGGRPQASAGARAAFVERAAAHDDPARCLEWPYGKANGYGVITWDGVFQLASRVVLTLATGGPPEPGMQAAHAPGICHNRACVNPHHLRWATPGENQSDRIADGTAGVGEQHPSVRLTEADVITIRSDPAPAAHIAGKYGVTPEHIRAIRRRVFWRNVP